VPAAQHAGTLRFARSTSALEDLMVRSVAIARRRRA
jgi:hypothetical protein